MNKSYVFLIGILVFLAIAVGGFALYKSTTANKATSSKETITPAAPVPAIPTPPPLPIMTEEEQIAKNNTLSLIISTPQNNSQVTSPNIVIFGTTAPLADVSVNDKDLKADAAGKFSSSIILEEGDNYILIVASSESSAAEWQGTVTYTPSQ